MDFLLKIVLLCPMEVESNCKICFQVNSDHRSVWLELKFKACDFKIIFLKKLYVVGCHSHSYFCILVICESSLEPVDDLDV